MKKEEKSQENRAKTRPPVVVVLGHVDHGKCVTPNTLVPLSNGKILTIKEIWRKYGQKKRKHYVKTDKKEGWVTQPNQSLKVFSFDGKKSSKKRISQIWKLKSSNKIIKVELASGDTIEVTPEHPFFVLTSKGKIIQKKADSLEKKDFILVPQKMSFSKKIKEMKKELMGRLARIDNLIVFLNQNKGNKFFNKLRIVNKQDLYRKGLFSTRPYNALSKKRLRARDFVKVGRFLKIPFEELYEMIEFIKHSDERQRVSHRGAKIKLPSLPDDLKKLGYILGCLAGDGKTEHGTLYNSNPQIQTTFRKYIEKLFGISTKLVKRKTGYKIVNKGWKTMTRFLVDIADFPLEKKSKKIKFPELFWTPSFSKGFIAGWFDTDGYISQSNHSIEFVSKSQILVKKISIYLLYFGIHSAIYKNRKKAPGWNKKKTYFSLRIANKPYLLKFFKNFPVKHQKKKEKIKEALSKTSTSRIFDLTPLPGKNLKSFYIDEHLFPYFSKYRSYEFLSRHFLKKLLKWKNKIVLPEIFSLPAVKNLLNPGEISCVKVKNKKRIENKSKFVYDLTVSESHNFVAERMFIHNTAILDYIRKSNIIAGEAGGITQHIGAYEVEHKGKKITFIDTPGHEAFSAMRSRGAKTADIAILVVDAAEGVREQTKEAILAVKKAEIPMIVALNKIDKPKADPEKAKRELSESEVLVESMGGDIPSVETSAKTKEGIDELLELVSLVAEMEELKRDTESPSEGTVIEAHLDHFKGPMATLILKKGTLKEKDIIGTHTTYAKIKSLEDFQGKRIKESFPSQPVIVLGFEKVPQIGDRFKVYSSVEEALERIEKEKGTPSQVFVKEENKEVLNIILKADVSGSLEAIENVLKNLPQEKVTLRILKSEVGEITDSDVKLAEMSSAYIAGFRVKVNQSAEKALRKYKEKPKIKTYDIIYELIQGVRGAMEKKITPKIVREDLGKVRVLVIFRTRKTRQIIGGKVIEGEARKGAKIEIVRDEEKIGKGKVVSLQQNKRDAEKLKKGEECGILYEGDTKIQKGDTLLLYTEEKKKI